MEMRQLVLILALPLLLGAAPSRTQTYTAGEIIDPSDVTENENNIYTYLQAGVDVIADNAVLTGDISNGTIIAADIADAAVTSAIILNDTIVNADINSSAAIALSKLASCSAAEIIMGNASGVPTCTALGTDASISAAGALTIAANAVALGTDTTGNYAATVADAGNTTITVANSGTETAAITLDAVDVNCSNCIDGTDIALGSDAQGDVYYYNGTDVARLGAGTAGQVLITGGAAANPSWSGLNENGRVGENLTLDSGSDGTDVSITTGVSSFVIVTLTGNISATSVSEACTVAIRRDTTAKVTSPSVDWALGAGITLSWSETLAAGTYAFDVIGSSITAGGSKTYAYQLQVTAVPSL